KMNTMQVTYGLVMVMMLFCAYSPAQGAPQDCPGCPVEGDPQDPEIQKYAEQAVDKIENEANCGCAYELVEISHVTTQVVAGELVHLDLVVVHEE
ncbi:hypothetical protein L9F63_017871, partial [Diploptera punctata]